MKGIGRVHALLIGIDDYLPPPNAVTDPAYPTLRGCVTDAQRMADLLVGEIGVPVEQVRLLTAPWPPAADASDLPTCERMVAELQSLPERAEPGDTVWIHFSGHGGRAPTVFPQLGGRRIVDEVLVPPDIARSNSHYLRDIELSYLLERCVRRGLFVTLVLDCCHSGGLLRDESPSVPGAMARSNRVERKRRERLPGIASERSLFASWRRFGAPWRVRGSCGYVMLAACREHEQAWEYRLGPSEHGGALSQALLGAIREIGLDCTYRQLFERVHGRIRERFEGFQTPRLEGESDRRLFGGDSRSSIRGLTVLAVEPERVLLATGRVQGVGPGDRFALEPLLASLDSGSDVGVQAKKTPAVVELIEPGGAESWARWVRRGRRPTLAGDRALPLRLLASRHDVLLDESLGAFAERLREIENPFLGWERAPPAPLRLSRDAEQFSITQDNDRPLEHPIPDLDSEDTDPGVVVRLLERLVRWQTVQRLVPEAGHSPLASAIDTRLGRLPSSFRPRVDPVEPIAELEDDVSVPYGTWLALTLRNRSRQPLEIAVLALDPSWCVQQLYPSRHSFLTLAPGASTRLPLRTCPPVGEHGLKIFATLDAVRWHWLELPPGPPPRPSRSRPRTSTEVWLSRLLRPDQGGVPERMSPADTEWTVEDLRLRIVPSDPTL